MARATYICLAGCEFDWCPCTPVACDVYWEAGEPSNGTYQRRDGMLYPVPDADNQGYPIEGRHIEPCIYGSMMARGRHPIDDQGRTVHLVDHADKQEMHEWAEGENECRIIPWETL